MKTIAIIAFIALAYIFVSWLDAPDVHIDYMTGECVFNCEYLDSGTWVWVNKQGE